MAKIIDEKQTGKYRLLILDTELDLSGRKTVTINEKSFNRAFVHGLPRSLAIECNPSEPTMIGYVIE